MSLADVLKEKVGNWTAVAQASKDAGAAIQAEKDRAALAAPKPEPKGATE